MQITTEELVEWVNVLRLPMKEVCQRSGMTRQGIWTRLTLAGHHIPRKIL